MDLRVFASLPDRDLRREGLIVGEGRLVAERVAARCRLVGVLAEPSAAAEAEALAAGRCPVAVLSAAEMEALAGYPFHRGLLVAAERPSAEPLPAVPRSASGERARRIVVLPEAADPENLGAVVRTAAALGWDCAALGPRSCDPFGRRALRCSMGATLALPLYFLNGPAALDGLRREGWDVAAAALEEGAGAPAGLRGRSRLALVLGNERSGLGPAWRAACAEAAAVPQALGAADGVDSLNVAAAAAILLWEGRPG